MQQHAYKAIAAAVLVGLEMIVASRIFVLKRVAIRVFARMGLVNATLDTYLLNAQSKMFALELFVKMEELAPKDFVLVLRDSLRKTVVSLISASVSTAKMEASALMVFASVLKGSSGMIAEWMLVKKLIAIRANAIKGYAVVTLDS
jgi:hypothetical protein